MVGLTGEAALDIRDSAEQGDITLFIAVVFLDCFGAFVPFTSTGRT